MTSCSSSSSARYSRRVFSTLIEYQRNFRQVPRMEHHILSAAVFQAGKDKVRDKELWKAYQKQAIALQRSLTLKDCRFLAQGFIEPELRWRSFGPLFAALVDQLRGLLGQAKSLRLDLCLCINAFAKVRVTDPGLFSAVGDVIVNHRGSDLNHIDYGALTNAFARCSRPHTKLCAFITEQHDLHWGPTSLGTLLTALANLHFRPSKEFLDRSTALVCTHAAQCNARDLSGAVFGLQRLLEGPVPQDVVDAIEPVVLQPDFFRGQATSLAYFCASLESNNISDAVRDMVLHTARRELSTLSSSQLSMVIGMLPLPIPEEFCEQIQQLVFDANWKDLCLFARCGSATTWPSVLKRALKITDVPDANSLSWVLLKGVRDPRTAQLAPRIPEVKWTPPTAHRALEALASMRLKDDNAIRTLMQSSTNAYALARLGVPVSTTDDLLVAALQAEKLDESVESAAKRDALSPAAVVYYQALGRLPPEGTIKVLDEPLARGSGFLRDVHAALRRVGLEPSVLQPYGAFVAEAVTQDSAGRQFAWLLETPKCFFLGTRDVTPMQLLKRRSLRHRWTIINVPYWQWPSTHEEQDTYIRSLQQ